MRKLALLSVGVVGFAFCLEAWGQVSGSQQSQPIQRGARETQKFVFQIRGRRDPFKPPKAASVPVPTVLTPEKTLYSLHEEDQYLKLAEQLVQQIDSASRAAQHREVVAAFSRLAELLPERFPSPEKRQRLREIQERAARAANDSRAFVLAKEGEAIIGSMGDMLNAGDYDALAKLDSTLRTLIQELRFDDPVVKALVEDLSKRAANLVERAKVQQECLSLVRISAIAWSADSPAAIINDRVAEQGDFVEGDARSAQILVKSIQEDSVTFSYKGEEVTKGLVAPRSQKQ